MLATMVKSRRILETATMAIGRILNGLNAITTGEIMFFIKSPSRR